MKKWIIGNPDSRISVKMSSGSDLSPLCADVMVSRGITDLNAAAQFVRADALESPFAVRDMDKAVDIINEAVECEQKICIYGDYDCDGITSTVMLYSYLECIGADVSYYIPERSEGYGLNKESVHKLADAGTELIITVDNGISAIDEALLIKELGMKLVITDHHQPGEELPEAEAIINPHRKDCSSSFKYLCGAGVVLKLIAAMEGGDYESAMEQFGDLAAVGTIADIVSLTGENRYIVEQGLMILRNTERCGLIELMKLAGIIDDNGDCKKITSDSIAFMIAPRINASGRFGSPSQAFELLMCDDPDAAAGMADSLNDLNNQRKAAENEIIEQIFSQINNDPAMLSERVLLFYGENWHHGVIGIVAAKLLEKYGKPCIIITKEGDVSRGSARAFGDFSVFECLTACEEVLLKYGGHMGAGGFSLKTSDIEKFHSLLRDYSLKSHESMPVYTIRAEKLLRASEITVKNVEGLNLLEPFGEGNEKPFFALAGAVIEDVIPLSGGAHTKLKLSYEGMTFYALMFRVKTDEISVLRGQKFDFIVSMTINEFRGQSSVEFMVNDFRKSGINQDSYFAANDAYEKYIRNEKLPDAYYKRMCPDREDLIRVYSAVTEKETLTDELFIKNDTAKINICKLKICLDIFRELGLVDMDYAAGKARRLRVNKKSDLENSKILRGLRSKWETKVVQ